MMIRKVILGIVIILGINSCTDDRYSTDGLKMGKEFCECMVEKCQDHESYAAEIICEDRLIEKYHYFKLKEIGIAKGQKLTMEESANIFTIESRYYKYVNARCRLKDCDSISFP